MKPSILVQQVLQMVAGILVLISVGCGSDTYDPGVNRDTGEKTVTVVQDLGTNCGALQDCEPYRTCVTSGTVQCQNNRCFGIGMVDLECVIKIHDTTSTVVTPTASTTCGQVNPPSEETNKFTDHANCGRIASTSQFVAGRSVKAWVNIVGSVGSTAKMTSLIIYGVKPDKTLVPVGGTAVNGTIITWSGLYERGPIWFDPNMSPSTYGRIGDIAPNSDGSYAIPSVPSTSPYKVDSYVVHVGGEAVTIAAPYVDYVVVGSFRTTGNAQVNVGLDVWSGSQYIAELGNSNWYACSTGTVQAVSYNTAVSDPCSNQLGTVVSPTSSTPTSTSTSTSTTTSSSTCPFATGLYVEPAAPLLSWCSTVQVVTWDKAGNLHAGSPGTYFHEVTDVTGIAAFDAMCGSTYRPTTAWPVVGSSAATAGFGKICSQGIDITAKTVVCLSGGKPKLAVAANPYIAGQCN